MNNEALLICPWPRKATVKIIGDMFIGERTIYPRQRYLLMPLSLSLYLSHFSVFFKSKCIYVRSERIILSNSWKLLFEFKKSPNPIFHENWVLRGNCSVWNYFRLEGRIDSIAATVIFSNIDTTLTLTSKIDRTCENTYWCKEKKKKVKMKREKWKYSKEEKCM